MAEMGREIMDGIDIGMLTEKVGPLHFPVWAYGAIGAVGILAVRAIRGKNASGNTFEQGSGAAGYMPAATKSDASTPTMFNPMLVGSNAVYDPQQGQLHQTENPFTSGGFLEKLGDFFKGLPNAPNDATIAGPDGYLLTFSNGVATSGNGLGLQSGISQQGYWDTQRIAQQGYWDSQQIAQHGYWDYLQFLTQHPGAPYLGPVIPGTMGAQTPRTSPVATGSPGFTQGGR